MSIYNLSQFALLRRQLRKLRFLISNFKQSTGLFELALPDSAKATCSASFISHLAQSINCVSNLGDYFKSMPRNKRVLSYTCGLLTRTPFVSSPSFNYLPELTFSTSCISRKFFYLSSLKYDTIIGYFKVQRRKRWYYQILKKISLNMLNSWFQQVSMSNLVTRFN
ncbi:hypothetical protein F9831_03455 [Streptococcus suis]|nr:hypothetical protein [Streptococcus suis]